ncbi:hypothetical protein [Leucobacter soli]|uniref:hypothetical protein n=1 Tax=Leucobacter soli TaxID=2812850 RepID=UPI00361AC6D0
MLTAAITALGQLEGRPRSAATVLAPATWSRTRRSASRASASRCSSPSLRTKASRTIAGFSGSARSRRAPPRSAEPPIALGLTAADGGATAMLDVSDGLSIDAARIARASRVSLDLDPEALAAGFGTQKGERVPLDAMLHGGEDHGLLAAFRRRRSCLPGSCRSARCANGWTTARRCCWAGSRASRAAGTLHRSAPGS